MEEQTKKGNAIKIIVDVDSLAKIAIWLDGYKAGRGGNLLPLGNIELENLWAAIKYLQGDVGYRLPDSDDSK